MSTVLISEERALQECTRFLVAEADALDNRDLEGWLGLMSRQIDYAIPVRVVRSDDDEFSPDAFFMKEDYGTLSLRVKRLGSKFAWAENPPTRTRRLVSNFRLTKQERPPEPDGGYIGITSNFAVFCYRGDVAMPKILSGERRDILVREDGALKLARRLVLLDTTVLELDGALSIFL